ncbi:MAG: sucrose-phosphate synthase [Desulfobacteraceae bacterium Eth-SRB1]|nr:MAG: sucrose-phosphate synthase [Desulfobacteraceae bacterium Eth-SRB1]
MKKHKIYIQMFSIHGLIRSENMELGRDADTGGQINYVVELGKALSKRSDVERIDLFTRLIMDKAVSEDYSRPIEKVSDKFRIVRIQCGGRKYIRKELLWPRLDEFVDKTIKFIKRENAIPDIVHGHYADAGYVAIELAKTFGIPLIFTGHSLGRVKREKLLNNGLKQADIIKKYKIDHRIHIEEDLLKNADLVITSTGQEIEKQYGMYRNNNLPAYRVIPPGLDLEKFYPYYHDMLPETEKDEVQIYAQAAVLKELNRFFSYPDKPLILTLCRPDERKNISGLVKAYGEDLELQAMSNLAVFAGIRKDITEKEENERNVLTKMLLLMDKYDLYGKMAIPKKHDFEYEVPELYRIAAEKNGVFINPALTEPFGLTLLEASATGLPIVATNDGGPKDIILNCGNGILVDPTNTKKIAAALKTIIADHDTWEKFSKNGIINVRKHYSWEKHAEKYIKEVKKLVKEIPESEMGIAVPSDFIGKRLAGVNYFIITDIDNTLIGEEENKNLNDLLALLTKNRDTIGFCVATGRTVASAVEHLKQHRVHAPDIIISSVGSGIYYGKNLHYSQGWETHISNKWNRAKIVELLKDVDFLEYQEEITQRQFKISYLMKPGKDRLAMIHDLLLKHKCRYNLIYSHQRYLDILPYRASKGKAIRYLSYKWEIPLKNILVCGDSGNDEEMLCGEPLAVVVGNYSEELEKLKHKKNIYFAKQKYAGGIMEAVKHYNFIKKAKGEIL